jgi:hypothetical protein
MATPSAKCSQLSASLSGTKLAPLSRSQLRISIVAGELQSIEEIGSDPGNETGDPDKQKRQANQAGGSLNRSAFTAVHAYRSFA